MELTVTVNESIWQKPLNKINAEKQAQHDAEQAAKPEEERAAFVPQTVEQYVTARLGDIEDSYKKQIEEEELAAVRADPVQYNRLMTALLDPALRQQLSDIIDASQGPQEPQPEA